MNEQIVYCNSEIEYCSVYLSKENNIFLVNSWKYGILSVDGIKHNSNIYNVISESELLDEWISFRGSDYTEHSFREKTGYNLFEEYKK